MFVDASALAAVILLEEDAFALNSKMAGSDRVLTSALAVWEASRAVARVTGLPPEIAHAKVRDHLSAVQAVTVEIGLKEEKMALEAVQRFGKGRHPAKLNMGDCFSYACARTYGVPLLYKGDDFALTDVERA